MIVFTHNDLRLVVDGDQETGDLAILDFLSDWADGRPVQLSATGPEARTAMWTEQGMAACAVLAGVEFEADWMMVPEGAADGPVGGEMAKHYGPGPHPGTGTPQTVHAPDDSPASNPVSELNRLLAMREARWLDEGNKEGPASEAVAWFLDRGVPVTFGHEFAREPTLKAVTEAKRAAIALQEAGISILPTSLHFRADSATGRMAETSLTGGITMFTSNFSSLNVGQETNYTVGQSNPFDSYIHEIGHLIDLRSDDLNGDELWSKYGNAPTIYANMLHGHPRVQKTLGLRTEYLPEAFMAAWNGDERFDSELRELVMQEAKKISGEKVAVAKAGADESVCVYGLSYDEYLAAEQLAKHYGPGPHPGTGSPQTIHAPGAPGLGLSPRKTEKLPEDFKSWDSDAQVEWFAEKRALKDAWENEARYALSMGHITKEQADELGYLGNGWDDEWKPLPDTLYHVTTAGEAVAAEGLKTRYELNQGQGMGLGGGERESISFSDNLEVAEGIYAGMLEAHDVAIGKITVADMLHEAETDGYLDRMMRYWSTKWKEGDPLPAGLQEAIESDDVQTRFDTYKWFASVRESVTGQLDPLFFSNDAEGFAAIDPSQIQLLQFRPVEGAHGYQMGSLAEWRTGTGDAVELVNVMKHYGPGPHPGTGTDQNVHGSGSGSDSGSKLTLYRGEGSPDNPSPYYPPTGPDARAGMWWTDKLEEAQRYAAMADGGKVYSIEVDESEVEREGLGYLIADPEVRARRQEYDDYRGAHQPSADYGAPAHDLTQLVAEDIYTHPHYYMSTTDESRQWFDDSVQMIRRVRNKPDAPVTVYRAVPKGVTDSINPGDWVTPSRSYAESHGESNLGDFDVLEVTVPAKELVWPGDYLPEWGWFPNNELGKRMLKMRAEAAEFAKHYGPGPHPGTGTPQSVHAPSSTLDPDASTLDDTVVEGAHSTMTISGNRSPGMDEIISNAFLHFDDKFPGLLPPDVRAVVLPPDEVPFEAGETAAWVYMSEPTLWINPYQVGTPAAMEIYATRAHDSHMAIFKLMSAIEDQLTPMKLANTLYEGIVFHELAHIAAQNMDKDLWSDLPYYSPFWYPERVGPGDPTLPSDYAAMTGDAHEFFAEAVMDWAYSPDPAPLSTLTAEMLREYLND